MTSTVDGLQDTVAVRPGQRQGLFFIIYNPSDWTQTVLGPADRWAQSLGSTFAQFGVSARGLEHGRLPPIRAPRATACRATSPRTSRGRCGSCGHPLTACRKAQRPSWTE